jgi:ribosome recycling factor
MSDDLELILEETRDSMKKALNHLESELVKIRAGKASPQMLEGLTVDYYGSPTLLNQVGNVSVMDARTLTIQPWEKNMLQPIERAIINANLGVTPQNDGNIIRLFMPPLTEERRREFVKRAGGEGEQSRVAIRSIRREAIEQIKKLQKDGLSEDEAKDAEKEIQDITDKNISLVEKHLGKRKRDYVGIDPRPRILPSHLQSFSVPKTYLAIHSIGQDYCPHPSTCRKVKLGFDCRPNTLL